MGRAMLRSAGVLLTTAALVSPAVDGAADVGPWRGPVTAIDPPPSRRAVGTRAVTRAEGPVRVAAAVLDPDDDQPTWMMASRRSADREFGEARDVGRFNLALAARPDGSVVAAWDEITGDIDDRRVVTSIQSTSGSWTRRIVLDPDAPGSPLLDVSDGGTTTAIWFSRAGTASSIKPYGKAWTPRRELDRRNRPRPLGLDVAADGSAALLTTTVHDGRKGHCQRVEGLVRTQIWSRRAGSLRWSRPVIVRAACVRLDDGEPIPSESTEAVAAGNRGKVVVVYASATGTYSRTRLRADRAFTPKRRLGVGATFVNVDIGHDQVTTLAYGRPTTGLITKTQTPRRSTWGHRRVLATASDSVVAADLSTGTRGDAVIGWRQDLTAGREEVHVRTKGRGNGPWSTERVLGVAVASSHQQQFGVSGNAGWVHRGTGGSTVASWIDPDGTVKASTLR
jgi:hypothetical protein